MTQEHKVFIGPGMDGRTWGIKFLTRNWKEKHGLDTEVLTIIWKDDEPFEPKFLRTLDVVDAAIDQGCLVDLIGCSASGQLMLNIFAERRDKVHRGVNMGGFLRPGNEKGIRSLERRSSQSIAFKEGVYRFVDVEPTLTPEDKKKILTVRPQFGDELVPPNTVIVQGALNKTVPIGEHVLSIATTLFLYDPVILFLKGNSDSSSKSS